MKIHKEGHLILIVMLIVVDAIGIASYIYVPQPWSWLIISALIVLFLLVLQFFRHPHVSPTEGENLVVAPADGKVVVIEEAEEGEILKDRRKQISIFMSPLNVHVNRSPIEGNVTEVKYHPGKYLVAWHPKSSTENERTTIVMKHATGAELVMRQIAGAVARRIKWYVKGGDSLKQGEEFGFIKFGSRVDIYLPLNAEIRVNEGEKTKAGVTVLAELK